jgi:hypothetical protein
MLIKMQHQQHDKPVDNDWFDVDTGVFFVKYLLYSQLC